LILPALMPLPPLCPYPGFLWGWVGFGCRRTGKTDEEELFKGIFPPKSTRVIKIEVVGGRGNERTLDEFAVLTENKENILPTVPSRRGPPYKLKGLRRRYTHPKPRCYHHPPTQVSPSPTIQSPHLTQIPAYTFVRWESCGSASAALTMCQFQASHEREPYDPSS